MSHINEVVNMNNITVQDVYKEIGGVFHCYQTHDPNLQPNHTILRYANTILLEKHFVFHINGVGTCRAARVWSRRFSHLS